MKKSLNLLVILLIFSELIMACSDIDNDGYGVAASSDCLYNAIDCNDLNASVHPNARELCNFVDDNCDGLVDNLFNSTEIKITKCECTGYRMPKREVCDGIDNDCNTLIDEIDCERQSKITGRNFVEIMATTKPIVTVLLLLAVGFLLGGGFVYFTRSRDLEKLAGFYHEKGDLAYEAGNFKKARYYYEKASGIRRSLR